MFTVSVPWVPPLELLLEEEPPLDELLLDDEVLLEDELLPEEDDVPLLELSLLPLPLPPPPQPAIAIHATRTSGTSAVRRITPVSQWWRDERTCSAYNRKDRAGENVAVQ